MFSSDQGLAEWTGLTLAFEEVLDASRAHSVAAIRQDGGKTVLRVEGLLTVVAVDENFRFCFHF